MITQIIVNCCTKCHSENIVKNGQTIAGKQKYHCKTCGAYGTLNPSVPYTPERKAKILRVYHERSSLRGMERTFSVACQTVAKWLREEADSLPEMPPLQEAQPDDVLEIERITLLVVEKREEADPKENGAFAESSRKSSKFISFVATTTRTAGILSVIW